eukprot:CAMPEP_0178840394 /NCGR_PEP_ID=MMETSP0746-20121128/14388_1 /TAXON_ID=913974 /ORGANISM="Nitzschia punctata, Strain CCMP561" /LENGTH=141 /DNA_ID=CAMNT_0020503535 /DNA_START=11 /DNA_END=433 /DNA_ORIENTATION=-
MGKSKDENNDVDGRQPHNRELHFSRKENSEFKWKHDKSVVGALEVKAEPVLDLRAEMVKHDIYSCEEEFKTCLRLWEDQKLRPQFIEAWENMGTLTGCCGLINNYDATIKHNCPALNDTWAKSVNEKYFEKEGYKISLFVW